MLIDDPEVKRRVEERQQKLAQQEKEAQQRYAELNRRVREWAVCPQLYTPPELGESYLKVQWLGPAYFATESDALTYHHKHPDESLLPVPVTHMPAKGSPFRGKRFSEFLPLDRVKGARSLSHPTLLTSERTQQEESIGCAIDPRGRWRIATIVNEAALGLGHTIGRFENPLQALLSGAYDLERTLYVTHPDISGDGVIDFWTSFEAHEAIQHHGERIEGGYSADQVRIALVILRQHLSDYLSEMLSGDEIVDEPTTRAAPRTSLQMQIDQLLADKCWTFDQWVREAGKFDSRKFRKINKSTAYRFYKGAHQTTAANRALLAKPFGISPIDWK